MTRTLALLLWSLGIFAVSACSRAERRSAPAAASTSPVVARSTAKPQIIQRTDARTPLQQVVQQHVEEADAQGLRVLVYVGAEWCEPCKVFHKSMASGELDEVLAGTRFVEFDADKDRAELRAAGYGSKYIPLFSVPDHSGHASGRAIEGSIKGADAVKRDLVPRLLALLDGKTD